MDVTRRPTPRKKSPAKWLPRMLADAMRPLRTRATWGVCHRGWTAATPRGKTPSSAQANMRRDTARSIAGRSFASATAAPATMSTVQPGERRYPSIPGAVRSWVWARSATKLQGTAWYTAAVKRR